MQFTAFKTSLAIICLASILSASCSYSESTKEDGHEHGDEHEHEHGHSHDHDHGIPDSFSAGVEELRGIWTTIATAMESGDLDAAHGPLHDVGTVLGSIADLAAETDLSETEWNEVKAEVDKLVGAFNKIDSAFHDEDESETSSLESIKETIDEALSALEAKIPPVDEQESDSEE